MAGTLLAFLHWSANQSIRCRCQDGSRSYLAAGSIDDIEPSLRKPENLLNTDGFGWSLPAWISQVRAWQGPKGGDERRDGIGSVSAWVLSRRTNSIHSSGTGTRPPVRS